jgi:hypothetical protein
MIQGLNTWGRATRDLLCHPPSSYHTQGWFYNPQELNRCMSSVWNPPIPPWERNAPCLSSPWLPQACREVLWWQGWITGLGTAWAKELQGPLALLPGKMLIFMGPLCGAPILHHHPRWWMLSAPLPCNPSVKTWVHMLQVQGWLPRAAMMGKRLALSVIYIRNQRIFIKCHQAILTGQPPQQIILLSSSGSV